MCLSISGANIVGPSENAMELVNLIHNFMHREEATHSKEDKFAERVGIKSLYT